MNLGAFSVSLAVKDLEASKAFYEKLGFDALGGGEGWLMLKSGSTVLGLFQGMFEKNMLTFNPGWDQDAQPLESFTDVHALRDHLTEQGVEFADEGGSDLTTKKSFVIVDPDGNPILIDQHV